jgi:chorismate lyase / 3-hydroxybenzoate synthase
LNTLEQHRTVAIRNVPANSPHAALDECVLARLNFGVDPAATSSDPRDVAIGLQSLDGAAWSELWRSESIVRSGKEGEVKFAENGDLLFGSLFLDESQLRQLQRSTVRAYAQIDLCLQHLGFPHWLRAWHFLARITEGEGEQERYRRFNAGRHRAIELRGGILTELPAATAIGTHSRGLTICFLAGKQPIAQVENPRQISAFSYPEIYGRRSPSFSRAALRDAPQGTTLFVSGTASILGHATVHHGDARAQTEEALRNVDALLHCAAEDHLGGRQRLSGLAHKVYVRHPEDWPAIQAVLQTSLDTAQPVIALHADICRRDLLVEIEGVYCAPANQAA